MNSEGQIYFDNEDKVKPEDVVRLEEAIGTHWKLPELPKVERQDYFDDDLVAKVNELRDEPNQTLVVLIHDREAALRIIGELRADSESYSVREWALRYKNGTRVFFCNRPVQARGIAADAVLDHYSADDKLWKAAIPCLR